MKLSDAEISILHQALNEILHGPDAIEDFEFATRMGITREEAEALIARTRDHLRNKQKEILKNFFGGTFHQDFLRDHKNWQDALERYKRDSTVEQRKEVARLIHNFYSARVDSAVLEKELFSEFGCYYIPSTDGISAAEWLQRIEREIAS
jgi:hypothetical protein